MQQQSRGIMDANAEDVFIGNGVSELILFSLRALLNRGDESWCPAPTIPCGQPPPIWPTARQCTTRVRRKTIGYPTSTPWRACLPRVRAPW